MGSACDTATPRGAIAIALAARASATGQWTSAISHEEPGADVPSRRRIHCAGERDCKPTVSRGTALFYACQ
jgi:hypothetical protein